VLYQPKEDNMSKTEEYENMTSLLNIAIVKGYIYCMEYDTYSGREVEKVGSMYLKQGFVDGFLAGIAHKMGGGHD
jgi:hypothetical protein